MARHFTFPLITQVRSIATEAPDGVVPEHLVIEVRTSLGSGLLQISRDAARDLAAQLGTYVETGESG